MSLLKNDEIEWHFPFFDKKQRTFLKMLSKLLFWTEFPNTTAWEGRHEAAIGYISRYNVFIEKSKTLLIPNHFNIDMRISLMLLRFNMSPWMLQKVSSCWSGIFFFYLYKKRLKAIFSQYYEIFSPSLCLYSYILIFF